MITVSDEELIAAAQAELNPHHVGDRLFGDVASTLVTEAGGLYSGVCLDTGSGTGFCAEHAAVAAMVTVREHRIAKIVAVWRSEEGVLHVLPPCGRRREFIRQVDPGNLDAEVLLGRETSARLRDLLPPVQRMARSARPAALTRPGQRGQRRLTTFTTRRCWSGGRAEERHSVPMASPGPASRSCGVVRVLPAGGT